VGLILITRAGSITTVMVSADERSMEFRTRVEGLNEFAEAKEIPPVCVDVLSSHPCQE